MPAVVHVNIHLMTLTPAYCTNARSADATRLFWPHTYLKIQRRQSGNNFASVGGKYKCWCVEHLIIAAYCRGWAAQSSLPPPIHPLFPVSVFAGVYPSSHWETGEGHALEKSPDHHKAPVMRSAGWDERFKCCLDAASARRLSIRLSNFRSLIK